MFCLEFVGLKRLGGNPLIVFSFQWYNAMSIVCWSGQSYKKTLLSDKSFKRPKMSCRVLAVNSRVFVFDFQAPLVKKR